MVNFSRITSWCLMLSGIALSVIFFSEYGVIETVKYNVIKSYSYDSINVIISCVIAVVSVYALCLTEMVIRTYEKGLPRNDTK